MRNVLNISVSVLKAINLYNLGLVCLAAMTLPVLVVALALAFWTVLVAGYALFCVVVACACYRWVRENYFPTTVAEEPQTIPCPDGYVVGIIYRPTAGLSLGFMPDVQEEECLPVWDYEPSPAPSVANVVMPEASVDAIPHAEVLEDDTFDFPATDDDVPSPAYVPTKTEKLARAIEMVQQEGYSIREASRIAGVTYSVLHGRLKKLRNPS